MNHVAVVLAAGGSTRLGRAKQLLRRAGETLVHRAVRLALETAPTRTIVVTGALAGEVAAAVADLDCQCTFNPEWEQGLASSLACAGRVLSATDERVVVIGCDQPQLVSAHLALLAAAGPGRIAVASDYGESFGIPARVPADWLRDQRLSGDRGFGARLRALSPADLVLIEATELGGDIDTPEHLAAAIAAGWIDADP